MKKILGLTIGILVVIAMVAVGTYAYFSDTETSSNNAFTVGTLDLKINNVDGITATWGDAVNPVYPGYTSAGTVTLKNNGSIAADHEEIGFSNSVTEVATPAEILGTDPEITDVSSVMVVTVLSYNGTNLLSKTLGAFDNLDVRAADTTGVGNSDGVITLNELAGVKLGKLTPFTGLAASGTAPFAMTIVIPGATTGNGIQGDSAITTVTFGLFQDVSQGL
jgi:predicted ribosomally synthesized peptide with SipW-like signal peptide